MQDTLLPVSGSSADVQLSLLQQGPEADSCRHPTPWTVTGSEA